MPAGGVVKHHPLGLSLSVERDNPAFTLYLRTGFVVAGCDGAALTLALDTFPAR
jgi:hypothetical protein